MRVTKADLSAINAKLEDRLAFATGMLNTYERDLAETRREFEEYRKRYSPVTKKQLTIWFSMAVTGTTEETLLRAYLTVLIEVMQKYGEDDPPKPSIVERFYPKGGL